MIAEEAVKVSLDRTNAITIMIVNEKQLHFIVFFLQSPIHYSTFSLRHLQRPTVVVTHVIPRNEAEIRRNLTSRVYLLNTEGKTL